VRTKCNRGPGLQDLSPRSLNARLLAVQIIVEYELKQRKLTGEGSGFDDVPVRVR
jgi:hypothetical protein